MLLTVSRLNAQERYKGHDRVIQVLPELLRTFPDLRYLIAGDGDDRSRLESLAGQSGVSDRVIFAGEVPDEDLPDIYRLADAYVMPSTGEGFGIVFLEAAVSGLPIVGGGVDGSRDALADGAVGVCVDPSDSSSLMTAVETAIRSKREANVKLVLAARSLFQNHSAVLVNSCVAP